MDQFELHHPGQQIYFMAEDTFYPSMTEERAAKMDRYICLCQAHRDYVKQKYPYLADKIVIGSNGVKVDLIEKIEREEKLVRTPRKMVFASSPDRGLLPLLKIFRRAREWVSGADGKGALELHVFYGFQNLLTGMENQPKSHPAIRLHKKCMEEMQQPGVFWHDRTPQPELIRHWLTAGIFCHPSVFQETNMITVQDAQACGAIPITIPLWAAGEFTKHGVFIYGDPYNDPLTIARFAATVMQMCKEEGTQDLIRAEMMPWARKQFNWERSVDTFETWMYGYDRLTACTSQHLFGKVHSKGRGKILNVGCGDDVGGMKEIGAINLDMNATDPGLQRPNRVDVVGDARDLPQPFEPNTFDVVACLDMLEHYQNEDVPAQLLKFKQCLTPTGRIVFTVPNDRDHVNLPEDTSERAAQGFYGKHHPCPPSVVEGWLKSAGLRALTRERINYGWRDTVGVGVVCVPEESEVPPERQIRHSVIYLDYDPDNRNAEMRKRGWDKLLRSIDGRNVGWDVEVLRICLKGQALAVNEGFRQARGEFLHIVCNDVMIDDPGWLDKIAMIDAVTSWAPTTFVLTGQPELEMSLFCVPREAYERAGGWDEAYSDGYGFDAEDFLARVRAAGFKTVVVPVKAEHLCGQTFRAYNKPEEFRKLYNRNMEIYKERWKSIGPEGGWLPYELPKDLY